MNSLWKRFQKWIGSYRPLTTPFIIQLEATECGAVCLAIILGYHGRFVPINDLRRAAGVSRNGSTALGIVEAANSYGLEAEGYSVELDELIQYPFPLIAFWEFEHFIVLEAIEDDLYYVNDPRTGPLTYTKNEFTKGFTGVILTFTKTDSFKIQGRAQSFLSSIRHYVQGIKKEIVITACMQIAIALASLLFSFYAKVFVDTFLQQQGNSQGLDFLIIVLITLTFITATTFLQKWLLVKLNLKIAISHCSHFIQHLLRLPLSFFENHYLGEIAYRYTLNQQVADTFTGPMVELCANIILMAIFATGMFFLDPTIGYIVLLVAASNLFFLYAAKGIRKIAYARYQQDFSKSANFAINALAGWETWKATGSERYVFQWLSSLYTTTINHFYMLAYKSSLLITLPHFIEYLVLSLFYLIGAWNCMQGKLSLGGFLALQLVIISFLTPLMRSVEIIQILDLLHVDMNKIEDVLLGKKHWRYGHSPLQTDDPHFEGQIICKNLSYSPTLLDPPIIADINITIRKQKITALVGASGAGKSTAAKLIAGLLVPSEGTVVVDGIELTSWPQEALLKQIGLCQETPLIFEGTVKENITLFEECFSDAEITQSLCTVGLTHFLLEMRLEEEGRNISGGELQRIELARQLLRKPSFLILDEATSNLDETQEGKIYDTIKEKNIGALVLTHRKNTMQKADYIYVLDKGKVIQEGTYLQLSQRMGRFQEAILEGE